ncbi:hypothetical protein EJ05DRAFT_478054 [Pseudovirgaria hyperparasitica]|uniref:CDP-diacylglycerol--glycerol-3-phosphate 3-phosphatidyltransferase n=1 Tax=Pseudovirgaria hyperparasitica TaxID=470096 RepID=A0A6A6W0H1_9PEZI|nr:uncharacterized protein EJ05DRAFT_478054 [Pseudovirgaria hyperparasitica]KAF2756005.1 hypothetical protein EJ05DRAFT_478054 [Pseudovirgaria hyperparasitica]
MPTSPSPSKASMLGVITEELDKVSPRFEIQPSDIRILRSPTEFYETLKTKISNAKNRIYLSTLYIGKTEHELIATIRGALQKNEKLKVSFLTDALRGTRETPNASCASLLAPLVTEFGPERVEIRMYHTPNLTGIRKKLIPLRINEGWGLQHMKLYGIDDELCMSGANLSDDYFTNRQDRYHIFSSPDITKYFHRIHHTISSLSFLIQPSPDTPAGYTMTWPSSNPSPSPISSPSTFKSTSTALLAPLLKPSSLPPPPSSPTSSLIYPLLQLTPILSPDTSTEQPTLLKILSLISPSPSDPSTPDLLTSPRWTFTAGYFNPSPRISRALLATRPHASTIITAHPHANGFFNSPGISGMLPAAYTLLARRFTDRVRRAGLAPYITLKEWQLGTVNTPGGWTYHAKGFWLTLPRESQHPCLTLIGSSNYTKRSYGLDLEANVVVVARDEGLRRRLGEEVEWLQEHAREVESGEFEKAERKVGLKVRVAMWIVSVVGGAL